MIRTPAVDNITNAMRIIHAATAFLFIVCMLASIGIVKPSAFSKLHLRQQAGPPAPPSIDRSKQVQAPLLIEALAQRERAQAAANKAGQIFALNQEHDNWMVAEAGRIGDPEDQPPRPNHTPAL